MEIRIKKIKNGIESEIKKENEPKAQSGLDSLALVYLFKINKK